jgi:hypothetical protein
MRVLGQHPHIITFHGVATDPVSGQELLVFELALYGSLLEVLSEGKHAVNRSSIDPQYCQDTRQFNILSLVISYSSLVNTSFDPAYA